MTLETLATIKNPPVVYARQANINNGGQQQVNNGTPLQQVSPGIPRASDHPGETESMQNELSGGGSELLADAGTSPKAVGANSHLGALETVHRTPNACR
jgi:hypothetical protein